MDVNSNLSPIIECSDPSKVHEVALFFSPAVFHIQLKAFWQAEPTKSNTYTINRCRRMELMQNTVADLSMCVCVSMWNPLHKNGG